MQSDSAITVRVTAGPNNTGRLRTGDSDGLYWVLCRVTRLNDWRGPYADPAAADAAARSLLNQFLNVSFNDTGVSWIQWGKRFYKQNDGGGNGGKWILFPEGGYTYVPDLPTDEYTQNTNPAPPVYSASYAGSDMSRPFPRIAPEQTEFGGPLSGYEYAIITKGSNSVTDLQPGLKRPISIAPQFWALFDTPKEAIPGGLTPVRIEAYFRHVDRFSRSLGRTSPALIMSHYDTQDAQDFPVQDSTSRVTTDPKYPLALGEWALLNGPEWLIPDPATIPLAGVKDQNFTRLWITLTYRAVYQRPDGSLVYSDFTTDAISLRLCEEVRGPYQMAIAEPLLDLGTALPTGGSGYNACQGIPSPFSGPSRFNLPLLEGLGSWHVLTLEYDRGVLHTPIDGPGNNFSHFYSSDGSFVLADQGTTGYYDDPPAPQILRRPTSGGGSIYTYFAAYAVPAWDKGNPTTGPVYANGATWLQYDNTPRWHYEPPTGFSQAVLEVRPSPALFFNPNHNKNDGFKVICDGLIPPGTFVSNPPNDPDVIFQGEYLTYCLGTITVWISDDNSTPNIANNSKETEFGLSGKIAYWNVQDAAKADLGEDNVGGYRYFLTGPNSGPSPVNTLFNLAGKSVVGYDGKEVYAVVGGDTELTVYTNSCGNCLHTASGPFQYYLNCDQPVNDAAIIDRNPVNGGGPLLPAITLIPLVGNPSPLASVVLNTVNGPVTVELFDKPQKRTVHT